LASTYRPRAFPRYFLHDVHVSQVQLDELFALLSAIKAGEVSDAEAIQRLSRSPHWLWVALDPVTKLLLALDLGDRTLEMAQHLVHDLIQILAPGCVPLFLTDGFKECTTAVLTHSGSWVRPPRRQAQGAMPTPPGCRCPNCSMRRWSSPIDVDIWSASATGVFGTLDRITPRLAAHGWQINTAFIERVNLTIRQHVAAVGRPVITLCKQQAGIRQQPALYDVYYNFGLPHASLRQTLLQPEPTHGSGSTKRWRPRTPAIAAGLSGHMWTLREVLLYRVPPWPQPQKLQATDVDARVGSSWLGVPLWIGRGLTEALCSS
jgi:IS1 family transposase